MTTTALILAAFVIGFLLGDRRGVKEFNRMVTEHNDRIEDILLLQGITPEPDDTDQDEQTTLH